MIVSSTHKTVRFEEAKMNQLQRHKLILELVQENGFITIDDLVERFQVAPQTIRRDLNHLADEKKLSRHHGGAGALTNTENESYSNRQIKNLAAKEKIAKEIAKSIPNGASVFINIGTTTETIAKELLDHEDLLVVTNNINVAAILSKKEDFTVIIASGEVRSRDGGIIGETTCDFIEQFRTDFGVIGISGVSEDGSLLDFDYREVRVAQAIIKNSAQVFLAADNSKFGRNAVVRLGSVSQVDHVFTDSKPPAPIMDIMETANVNLHVV